MDDNDYRKKTVNERTDQIRIELRKYSEWVNEATTEDEEIKRQKKQLEVYHELVSGLLWVVEGDPPMADSITASLTGVSHGLTYGLIAHTEENGLRRWSVHT